MNFVLAENFIELYEEFNRLQSRMSTKFQISVLACALLRAATVIVKFFFDY